MRSLIPLLTACVQLARAWDDSGWTPEGNVRPNNITHLEYDYYKWIGSYYNGTLTADLHLADRNLSDGDFTTKHGKVCEKFIGKTVSVSYNAVTLLGKPSRNDVGDNPLLLYIWGAEEPFELMPTIGAKDYTQYQRWQTRSVPVSDQRGLVWEFDERNQTGTSYAFSGSHLLNTANEQELYFNLTQQCEDRTSSANDEEDFLFEGGIIMPPDEQGGHDTEWSDVLPVPTMSIDFNQDRASLSMQGLFRVLSGNTELVGRLSLNFHGKVDEDRSDELVIGAAAPEWNPTLGFSHTPADDESGAPKGPLAAALSYYGVILGLVLVLW